MKKYTLPKEFGEKWIAALRSGRHKQTHVGVLCDDDEYCCLGVACKIEGQKEFGDKQWIGSGRFSLADYPSTIPKLLIGNIGNNDFVRKVSGMNNTGKSFSEIADWIEANVELN